MSTVIMPKSELIASSSTSTADAARATDADSPPGVRAEVACVRAYSSGPTDGFGLARWKLDANECPPLPGLELPSLAAELGRGIARYPSAASLERALSHRLGLPPECVIVTAGGDDAIDRVCRACLAPGHEMIVATPTFEMIPRYAALAGGSVINVNWSGEALPAPEMAARITPRTSLIAVVSPNNPTGAIATTADLELLSSSAPRALLMVDLAYTEFAADDLTPAALALPNAVIVRTFSKAYGLAGLRVGFAASQDRPVIDALRAAGHPYPCSAFSLAAAERTLAAADAEIARRRRVAADERAFLSAALRAIGASVAESQANFVYAQHPRAAALWESLARQGVRVKHWPDRPGLADALRVTCPLDVDGCKAVYEAIAVAAAQIGTRS